MLLNQNNIDNSELATQPFPHAIINHIISKTTLKKLLTHFPNTGFVDSQRDQGSDKTYHVMNNILYDLNKTEVSHCIQNNDIWAQLVYDLDSQAYRHSLGCLLDIDLQKCFLEITLKRYQANHYISAHTDREHVTATHLIFLNPYWDKAWGGNFCIMSDPDTISCQIPSLYHTSVAFLRTGNSWHQVTPCLNQDVERLALQVAFWNTPQKPSGQGRQEEGLTAPPLKITPSDFMKKS